MKAAKTITVGILVLLPFILAGCGTMVQPGRKGLRWRPYTSGLAQDELHDGFYWHWPWNDVETFSLQWTSFSEKIEVLTQDDLHIRMDASVIARPAGHELYEFQMEVGPQYYTGVLKPFFLTAVRSIAADYSMATIPEKSPEIEGRILAALKERLDGKHIELDAVTIDHVDFTTAMLRAIENKLTKEQELIQKESERQIATEDAEIARIRAKGEGDALRIRAEGEAEAQKIRAGGQAEAQKLIDETLTPRYLQFKAFESPNAKLIYAPIGKDGLPLVVDADAK